MEVVCLIIDFNGWVCCIYGGIVGVLLSFKS